MRNEDQTGLHQNISTKDFDLVPQYEESDFINLLNKDSTEDNYELFSYINVKNEQISLESKDENNNMNDNINAIISKFELNPIGLKKNTPSDIETHLNNEIIEKHRSIDKNSHGDKKPKFSCEKCSDSFMKLSQLSDHIQKSHESWKNHYYYSSEEKEDIIEKYLYN